MLSWMCEKDVRIGENQAIPNVISLDPREGRAQEHRHAGHRKNVNADNNIFVTSVPQQAFVDAPETSVDEGFA
jgi:hypothetical protein